MPRIGKLSAVVVWMLVLYLGVLDPAHYTIESILSATIDDAVFGGMWQLKRHIIMKYANETQFSELTQRQRLDYTVQAVNATINVLRKADLQVFIDAGTLLGWYRHDGQPIPWDIDGDVAIIGEECLFKYPDQLVLLEKLRQYIEPPYHVENFDCHYPPRAGQDFTGIIVNTLNGFKTDIFTYNAVDTSTDRFEWLKAREWLQRDDERGRLFRVTPRDAVLPLQWGNFSGITGNILPNNVEEHLRWDYGAVLGAHVFPYRLNIEVSISVISILGLLLLLVNSRDFIFVSTTLVVFLLIGGGSRVVLLILCVALVQPGYKARDAIGPVFKQMLTYTVLAMLSIDMLPVMPQMFAHVMDAFGVKGFTTNSGRYCLFYEVLCVDS